MPETFPNDSQIMPKTFPNDSQIMPKTFANYSQIMPKTFLDYSQIMLKTFANYSQIMPKSCPNHFQNILCMYHMCIMCAYTYIMGICHWHVSYVDIIWRCNMEISYSCGDIIWWWVLKQKFHGFGRPPGGIFGKKDNLQNQECHFLKIACYPILILDSEST